MAVVEMVPLWLLKSDADIRPNRSVMALFKPRSWCTFCPLGTMTQAICRLKRH